MPNCGIERADLGADGGPEISMRDAVGGAIDAPPANNNTPAGRNLRTQSVCHASRPPVAQCS